MPMLYEFLLMNQEEILATTERKAVALAGARPSSVQLEKGLPIFYRQLIEFLMLKRAFGIDSVVDDDAPAEVALAASAGLHGAELLRLGYTLSHVVHAYGAMCQAITEQAVSKGIIISSGEFRDLNRCLDVAIAGAVTQFQAQRNTEVTNQEVEHLGFLAHELRNALTTVNVALQLIKMGSVGFGGSTGRVLDTGLKRIQDLVDRSLTEVRLRIDPQVHAEPIRLIQLVDQIAVTADIEARAKNQLLEINIDPTLVVMADRHLVYSALSNLVQNALKYTHSGGKIQVRGLRQGDWIVVEVEDECGGLASSTAEDLFKPFEQQHPNRQGLGLGLSIARRAVMLNHGKIEVRNLPGQGCIFKVTLP